MSTHPQLSVSSDDVLAALGLERRKPPVSRLAFSVGLALAGAVAGAGAVLLHAFMLGRDKTAA